MVAAALRAQVGNTPWWCLVVGNKLGYVTFSTDWGWIGVLGSAAGVRRLVLPRPSLEEVRCQLSVEAATWSPHLFTDVKGRLEAYFRGEPVNFTDTIDCSGATDFQQRVWAAARLIPYGETKSYGWLTNVIGCPKAARAVGQALARNPLPIIVPCHRVISGDGRLGGFGSEVAVKRRLLYLEGVSISR